MTTVPKRMIAPGIEKRSGPFWNTPDALMIIGTMTPTAAPIEHRMPYVKLTPMRTKQSIASTWAIPQQSANRFAAARRRR